MDDAIRSGLESLQTVAGDMLPLAARYVKVFRQLQSRLRTTADLGENATITAAQSQSQRQPTSHTSKNNIAPETMPPESVSGDCLPSGGVPGPGVADAAAYNVPPQGDRGLSFLDVADGDLGFRSLSMAGDGPFFMAGLDDELAVLQSAVDQPGWNDFAAYFEPNPSC